MKLVASLIVQNEARRFLKPCIEALLEYCDEIRAIDDNSTDGSYEIMRELGVEVRRNDRSMFFEHEGKARQSLLEWTMVAEPTVVLAIDADEFVDNGPELRRILEKPNPSGVWALQMEEVWGADERNLSIRQDGGWKEHPVGIVYWVPPDHATNRQTKRNWRIPDRALACGRVPHLVGVWGRLNKPAVASLLHFGWACEADREDRYQRYVKHDGGQHHAGSHLDSIMWPDTKVSLTKKKWPPGIDKETLLKRINGD
jgi:glycosyltransferase involved in cell wall biosynthesis